MTTKAPAPSDSHPQLHKVHDPASLTPASSGHTAADDTESSPADATSLKDSNDSPPRDAPSLSSAFSYLGHPNRGRLNAYILRHASAGTRRINPKIDLKRPLDKEGKQHCLYLAHVLNAMKLNFDLIVSSPLKRCLQTAQLIATEMGYESKILHAQALEPNAAYSQFERLVHECRTYENVLMVGHNPTLTSFLGTLIGSSTQEDASPARLRLRKGSLARVTMERGPGVLQWLLDPRTVRVLYTTSTKSSRRKTSRK